MLQRRLIVALWRFGEPLLRLMGKGATMSKDVFKSTLMAGAALGVMASATAAHAASAENDGDALEQIVVTSTRQADTVNRVPLSVTAVTQQSLDQSRVVSINDLARSVPSVVFLGVRPAHAGEPVAAAGIRHAQRSHWTGSGMRATGLCLSSTSMS